MEKHLESYLSVARGYIEAYFKGDYERAEIYREDVNYHWEHLDHASRIIAVESVRGYYREIEGRARLDAKFED